jgi:hypothetical protein
MARWFLRWIKVAKSQEEANQLCQPIFEQLENIVRELYPSIEGQGGLLMVPKKCELSIGGEPVPEGQLCDVVFVIFEADPQLIDTLNRKIRASQLEAPSELGWDLDDISAYDLSKKFERAGWTVNPIFPYGFEARCSNGIPVKIKQFGGAIPRKPIRTFIIAEYTHLRSILGDRNLEEFLEKILPPGIP